MSCGLRFLHRVVSAKSYPERHHLLNLKFGVSPTLLTERLEFLNPDSEDDVYILLEDYSEDQFKEATGTPFTAERDPDPGPFEAWSRTHSHLNRVDFICSPLSAIRSLRKRGYVMWDYTRLVEQGIFDSDWSQVMHMEDEAESEFEPEIETKTDTDSGSDVISYNKDPASNTRDRRRIIDSKTMRRSCERRKWLYDRGAEGWWSEDDESRLVWGLRRVSFSNDDEN